MKVSKEVAARHREALLEAAGRLFRERGFERVGIAEITAAAGLTHGAFYTHFASKQALQAEVVARLLQRSLAARQGARDAGSYLDAYLSPRHCADRATGCPLAALGGDVVREAAATRAAFAEGLQRFLDGIAPGDTARARAITGMAAMIGGLILARAASDDALRDEILAAVKMGLGRGPRATGTSSFATRPAGAPQDEVPD